MQPQEKPNLAISDHRPTVLLARFILIATGCTAVQGIQLKARAGNYTYDQAGVYFRPPENREELMNGTVIAEFLTSRGTIEIHVTPVFCYGYRGY